MIAEYKCGYCNKIYNHPGYCQHGKIKVALKNVKQIGSCYGDDLSRRQPGKSFNQS